MTKHELLWPGAALAGGAAWLAKVAVIVATDGETTSGGVPGVLYLAGVALMVLGAAGLLVRLTGRWFAAVLGPVLAIAVFSVLDAVAEGLLGSAGPAWMQDEWGILVTGLFWLALALVAPWPARGSGPAGAPASRRPEAA